MVKVNRKIRIRRKKRENEIQEKEDDIVASEDKICRYCLEEVNTDDKINVAKPCNCNTYIHQNCFKTWWEYSHSTRCELCHMEYEIEKMEVEFNKEVAKNNYKKLGLNILYLVILMIIMLIPFGWDYNYDMEVVGDRILVYIAYFIILVHNWAIYFLTMYYTREMKIDRHKFEIMKYSLCCDEFSTTNICVWSMISIVTGTILIGSTLILGLVSDDNVYWLLITTMIMTYIIMILGIYKIRSIFDEGNSFLEFLLLWMQTPYYIFVQTLGYAIVVIYNNITGSNYNVNWSVVTCLLGILMVVIPVIVIISLCIIGKLIFDSFRSCRRNVINPVRKYLYPTTEAPILKNMNNV